AEPLDHSPHP
ncbi:hypothetical protein D030_1735B, partial [Vibrio parahaemolyticus AQ3810]